MAALPKMVWSCIVTDDTTTALCLAHCSVTFFFSGAKAEGFGSTSQGRQMRIPSCKDPFKEEASTIRGRREGPETVCFCGGNGFGKT